MKVDLVKMLKGFFEEQGYDVDDSGAYLYVDNDDTDSQLSFVKSKFENFLMGIYSQGHDAGYRKGFMTRRRMQATMKDEK